MSAMVDMFNATVRIEHLIWIPGAVCGGEDGYPKTFSEEFCEGLPEREDAPLYASLPKLKRFATGDDYPEAEEVADVLLWTPGFLIQAATPVVDYFGDGKAYTYSWGHYQLEWLYAPTEADIAPLCISWAEAEWAEMKARKLEKAPGA